MTTMTEEELRELDEKMKKIRYTDLTVNQRINFKQYILENGEKDPALKGVYVCYKFFGFVRKQSTFSSQVRLTRLRRCGYEYKRLSVYYSAS